MSMENQKTIRKVSAFRYGKHAPGVLPTDGNYIAFFSGDQRTFTVLHLDSFQIYDFPDITARQLEYCEDVVITSDILMVAWNRKLPVITYYKIKFSSQTIAEGENGSKITEEINGPIIPERYFLWEISALKMENDYLIVAMNDKLGEYSHDPEILLWKKQELYGEPWKILKSKARYSRHPLKQYKDIYSDSGSIIALEINGQIFRWKDIENSIELEPEEVCDIGFYNLGGDILYHELGEFQIEVDTFRVDANGRTIVWDLFWGDNIMVIEKPENVLQRDPSSRNYLEDMPNPDYNGPTHTVRIDPACQYKAVIANDSSIKLRRILDKHDGPSSTNDNDISSSNNGIDIPVFDTMEAGLGKFQDAFLYRQLTGFDKGVLFIIYIGSNGFYKKKIEKIPVYSLQSIEHPTTRYVGYQWGEAQAYL